MRKKMGLTIIIPAWNEEKRIGRTLKEYYEFFDKKHLNFEILVVLNGCVDNTLTIIKNLQRKFKKIRYIELECNGKGLAVIEGFKDAIERKKEIIGFVDSDMSTGPESFHDLIEKVENHDGIIASRRIKGAKVKGQTRLDNIKSTIFNFLVRGILVLPYKDTQCGAKLFKREVIENIMDDIGLTHWAFDVDLLYKIKKKGYKIKEIPTIWENKAGSGHDIIRTSLNMLLGIVRLRFLNSPFDFVVRVYDKLPRKNEKWLRD
jgi:glycosyltransferase involved in cell wall biosynthesis